MSLTKLPFLIERTIISKAHDAALLSPGDALGEELVRTAIQSISTDLELTVAGTTMHLAAWEDPDHWSEDWAEKLGVEPEEVDDAVYALLQGAVEEEA